MTSRAVRAHEEKYRAEHRGAEAVERRVLSRYAGVDVADVARLEQMAPQEVRDIRARAGRSIDDGLPTHPSWTEQLTFEQLDRMMRTNRSAA